MNNEDLLKIAKGMGLDAKLVSNDVVSEFVGIFENDEISFFNPEKNKSQAFEVLEWLYDSYGVLNTLKALASAYTRQIDNENPSEHLIENILSIALQVVNNE